MQNNALHYMLTLKLMTQTNPDNFLSILKLMSKNNDILKRYIVLQVLSRKLNLTGKNLLLSELERTTGENVAGKWPVTFLKTIDHIRGQLGI